MDLKNITPIYNETGNPSSGVKYYLNIETGCRYGVSYYENYLIKKNV